MILLSKGENVNTFRLQIGNYELEFDRDYGCDKRTGWTVIYDGSVVIELEPSLFKAIVKGVRGIKEIKQWEEEDV